VAGVPLWRRLAIAGLLGFVVAVAVWSFQPWTSAVSRPPDDQGKARPQALFRCGPPFGDDRVDPSNAAARSEEALPHQPCTSRTGRRALAVADVALGSAGLVALVVVRRHRPADESLSTETQ